MTTINKKLDFNAVWEHVQDAYGELVHGEDSPKLRPETPRLRSVKAVAIGLVRAINAANGF